MTKIKRFLWVLGWFFLFILSQLPLSALVIGLQYGFPPRSINLLVIFFSIVVLASLLGLAKKTQLLHFKLSWFGKKELFTLLLYELGIIASNIIGSLVLTFVDHVKDTENQAVLDQLASQSSILPFFLLTVFVAPIAEEILCRGIIPKKIFYGSEKIGYLVGWLVFTLLHVPTNLGSFIIYASMSFILTYLAYRSQRLEMSILLHMIHNTIPFILLFLI